MTVNDYRNTILPLIHGFVFKSYVKCKHGTVDIQKKYISTILPIILYDMINENMIYNKPLTTDEVRGLISQLSNILQIDYIPDSYR